MKLHMLVRYRVVPWLRVKHPWVLRAWCARFGHLPYVRDRPATRAEKDAWQKQNPWAGKLESLYVGDERYCRRCGVKLS